MGAVQIEGDRDDVWLAFLNAGEAAEGIAAQDGEMVRKGQVIGYVGTSGLSTGAHLHYEVYRGGVAVNPLSVRFTSGPTLDAQAQNALKARVKALLSVTSRRG